MYLHFDIASDRIRRNHNQQTFEQIKQLIQQNGTKRYHNASTYFKLERCQVAEHTITLLQYLTSAFNVKLCK